VDELGKVAGHALISYVREDGQSQQMLEAAGVRVWRDTVALLPGADWAAIIRRVIAGNALAPWVTFRESHQAS
jgi:hypothetical protein